MTTVELQDRRGSARAMTSDVTAETHSDALIDDEATRVEQQLPPIDGGVAAWRLLCAAFMFEACLWGRFRSQPTRASWRAIC